MINRRVWMALAVAVIPCTVAFARGAPMVLSVEDLPEYLVAGEPVELDLGFRLGSNLTFVSWFDWEILLTGPNSSTQVIPATRTARAGIHSVRIVASEPGDWRIAIRAKGSGGARELLPLMAIAVGDEPPAPQPPVVRGAHLYIAKGCVTCHVAAAAQRASTVYPAPDLVGRTFPSADYVARAIAYPDEGRMPNLNLSQEEISALAAYLNASGAD